MNLKDEEFLQLGGPTGNFNLFNDVLRHDPKAFEYVTPVNEELFFLMIRKECEDEVESEDGFLNT
ncbi:hypothetical protein OROMI_001126 [Orobanche minor]